MIKIQSTELKKALIKAKRFTKRDTNELSLIKIKANSEESSLIIESTDSDRVFQCKIFAELTDTEDIILNSKDIEIITKMPEGEMKIDRIENYYLFSSGKSKRKINRIEEKFPSIEIDSEIISRVQFNSKVLIEALDKVTYATTKDEVRPILTGVHFFKNTEGKIVMTALDGYRLAQVTVTDFQADGLGELDIVIPAMRINEILKCIESESILVAICKKSVVFFGGNIIISQKLIEGTFVDTKGIIPSETNFSFEVKASELFNIVDSMLVGDVFVIDLEIQDNIIKFHNDTSSYAIDEELAIKVKDKKPEETLKISFNSRYLSETISTFGEETIDFNYIGPTSPVIFKKGDMLGLILPIRK